MARGGGGHKKRSQYCTDSSGDFFNLRALQGHSGLNLIDPSLQDNVLIPDDFFNYICHVGCAIKIHSIINSGLIPGGQNLSKRQRVFFLPVDLMDKEHKDPEEIDLEAPRLARYMHTAWKKHQNTVYWVDIKLAQKKGLKFYQTRSNAIIHHDTLPAYCIPKAVRMETGEIIYEKVYGSPRPPPKVSLRHDWMKELGSEVARQAEVNQQTQPNPNPIYRTGRPVVIGQPTGSSTPFEEVNIDFRVSGLPHKLKTLVFVSSWRRSRITLIDKIFTPIYNKIMPTTLSVKNQRRWLRAWTLLSYLSYARQFLKCNAKNDFFTGSKASFAALAGISWERINPVEVSFNGHGIFSQSRTMSLRKGDLMAIVMGKLKNKENILLPIIWGRDAPRIFFKGFTTASKTTQHFGNSCSALIELKRYASRWTKTRRKISPIEWRKMNTSDTKRIGGSLSINLENWTDERSFRLQRSVDQITPSSPRVWRRATRTDSLLAIPEMASVVFFIQHVLVAVERFLVELMTIDTKSYRIWAHERAACRTVRPVVPLLPNTFRSETLQFFFGAVRSFTADSSLLQPTEEWTAHLTRHIF